MTERPVQLARPTDRLAAVIVDAMILTPVELLVSAPLKRWFMKSYITGFEPDFFLTIVLMTVISVAVIVAYQSLFHYFAGATPGKRMFGLRIEPMFEGQKLTYWDCFFRSVVWIFESLCFGLPWLAVFSNPKRRPLHDRLCDTVVVTRTRGGVPAPMPWERGLVHGVFGMSLALIAVVAFWETQSTLDKMKVESAFMSLADKEAPSCEAVNPYVDEDHEADHARLKMAMSLYAAGLAERSCLEMEVEREVAEQVTVAPITYLAQAFVYADDAEVSNSYLDKVCSDAADSVECSMSRLVSSWSEDDWSGVEEIIRSAPAGSGYLEVWGVRHYMKQAEYSAALTLLDGLVSRHELSDFSLTQRVKALFNTYREPEAQAALAQAVAALPAEESRDLGAWVCAQQLQNGCEALTSVACQQVPKTTEESNIDYSNPPEALARVLTMECHGAHDVDYLKLSEATRDESWQDFFRANLKRQREDRSAAASLYTKVIASSETPDFLRVEATRRLLQFASQHQLETLVELWHEFDSKESWVKAGNMLFNRLAEQKNSELALKVARHLMNSSSLSPKGMTVLSAMVQTVPTEQRQPAAVKVRENVKHLLDSFEEEH